MNTLAAITDRVFQQLEGGISSDDSRLNIDLIRDKVLSIYASLVTKIYASYIGMLPDGLYQRCCIEIACTDLCGSGAKRLMGKIPKLMQTIGTKNLRFVGTAEGIPYERKKNAGPRYELYQKYAVKRPSYRMIGEDIELFDTPMGLEVIVVEGIFVDPSTCPPCVPDDELILPMPDLHAQIEVQAMKDLQQVWMQRRIDVRNDAKPNN